MHAKSAFLRNAASQNTVSYYCSRVSQVQLGTRTGPKRWARGQAAVRRYVQGQRFGRHFDDSVDLGQGRVTAYTLLIYLSGGCEDRGIAERLVGGETAFYGAHMYHSC